MRKHFARLLTMLLFKVVPPGTSIKIWKWDNGIGNAHEFTCPREKWAMPTWQMSGKPWDILEYLKRGLLKR